jgi:hypothetical protein
MSGCKRPNTSGILGMECSIQYCLRHFPRIDVLAPSFKAEGDSSGLKNN